MPRNYEPDARKQAVDSARSGAAVSLIALAVATTLTACGSGGSASDPVAAAPTPTPAPAPAPAPTTTKVPISVIDGAIKDATVCLDKNANGACDAGEPSGKTDAAGSVTLDVLNTDLGKYPVIALVGTDAVDAVNGPVTTPFTLSAPADKTALVTPLTTLVQSQVAASGMTSAQADAFLQQHSGLKVSLLDDFTKTAGTNPDSATAGTLARLVVLTVQQQAVALAPAIGKTDLAGAAITSADVNAASASAMINVLPALGAAAVDPAVTGATDKAAALASVAQATVAQTGLTAASAPLTIGTDRLAAMTAVADASSTTPAPAPAAAASLRIFKFTDVNNWSYRAFPATVADATPDANNVRRYYDLHAKSVAGAVSYWGYGTAIGSKDDLHWSGTAWVDCALGKRGTVTWLDALGTSAVSNYCESYSVNAQRRAYLDISGKTMTEIVAGIRAMPGGDAGVTYAEWGPADLTLLGTAVFPAGSVLTFQTNTSTQPYAFAYNPTSLPTVFNAAVAAGGDTRVAPAPACGAVTTSNFNSFVLQPATLDAFIASNLGKPCVYAPNTDANGNSGARSEWWSNSTYNLGTVTGGATQPAGTGNYYKKDASIRLGFAATGNGVTYYSCLITQGGSTRNCDAIGTGTHSIVTLGDARVVTFSNAPAVVTNLGNERIVIERGGKVYTGYRNRAGTSQFAQLNLAAANAIFTKLGVPPIVPN